MACTVQCHIEGLVLVALHVLEYLLMVDCSVSWMLYAVLGC